MADIFALLAGEENAGGGKITDANEKQWLPIIENDFRLTHQGLTHASNDNTVGVYADTNYVYVVSNNYIRKLQASDLKQVAVVSNASTRQIGSCAADDDYIYTGHTYDGIRKWSKATMTVVDSSVALITTGMVVFDMVQDTTHLYVAANTSTSGAYVYKIAKTNLGVQVLKSGYISAGAQTINKLVLGIDNTHIFATGSASAGASDLNPIWKMAKADLVLSNITNPSAGDSLFIDDTYIYKGGYSGNLTRTPKSFASGYVDMKSELPFNAVSQIYLFNNKLYVWGYDTITTDLTGICILDPANNFSVIAKNTIIKPRYATSNNRMAVTSDALFVGDGGNKPCVYRVEELGNLIGYKGV